VEERRTTNAMGITRKDQQSENASEGMCMGRGQQKK